MLLYTLFGLLIAFQVLADVDTKTVSIKSAADYLVARGCVQGCLWTGNSEIVYEIGCGSPYYNQCYCNLDQASLAVSFLSSCVPKSCSNNGPDVATAVSVYKGYCSVAGYPFGGANVAIQTSTQTAANVNAVTKTSSGVVTATATAISATVKPSSAGTSTPSPTLIIVFVALFWSAITIFQ
ncbi:hypothetical protein BGZ60DRAFT_418169 [Tricladium varicosporioides]|nr:hypothetical protein BGZ60DRAFT_418169 [Hymenoscyphus varicosporioides]